MPVFTADQVPMLEDKLSGITMLLLLLALSKILVQAILPVM